MAPPVQGVYRYYERGALYIKFFSTGRGEITAYCKNKSIDLIVTGHKRRSKLYSILFDSPEINIIDTIPGK
jgi:hypothetical protein